MDANLRALCYSRRGRASAAEVCERLRLVLFVCEVCKVEV